MLFSTQLNSPICYELHAKIYRTERRTTFFPLLPPTLLARALKAAVTLVHVPENRELLCRKAPQGRVKSGCIQPSMASPCRRRGAEHGDSILSLEEAELREGSLVRDALQLSAVPKPSLC